MTSVKLRNKVALGRLFYYNLLLATYNLSLIKGGFLMNIIIGNAWPYANGPLHLGRIAVLLPGDILARYHRMMGDDVVFLSGTDCRSHKDLWSHTVS